MTNQEFENFYIAYQDLVRARICTLLYYRPDLIDDALQEAWIKIWRGLPNLSYAKNVPSWVYLVTTNCVRDIMRSQKSHAYQRNSLEQHIERMGIDEDEFMCEALAEADPYSYIPERLDRQDVRQEVWNTALGSDRNALMAYINNEPVVKQRLYAARHNWKERYDRAVQRRERVAS